MEWTSVLHVELIPVPHRMRSQFKNVFDILSSFCLLSFCFLLSVFFLSSVYCRPSSVFCLSSFLVSSVICYLLFFLVLCSVFILFLFFAFRTWFFVPPASLSCA